MGRCPTATPGLAGPYQLGFADGAGRVVEELLDRGVTARTRRPGPAQGRYLFDVARTGADGGTDAVVADDLAVTDIHRRSPGMGAVEPGTRIKGCLTLGLARSGVNLDRRPSDRPG